MGISSILLLIQRAVGWCETVGGECEAILELLPKGKSGSPVKAWLKFS